MVDATLVPAIREAVKQNELGLASPYVLSYAKLGASGASFGIFQGDTNVNDTARTVLRQVLQAGGADADTSNRILAALSQACPNGSPLSDEDAALVDGALSSAAGRALVDGMDSTLLNLVLEELDSCIDAAATRDQTIAGEALLYIALWVNMTGTPTTLNKWLSGIEEVGIGSPAGPITTAQDIRSYLQANKYFQLHPKNFTHMQASVTAAAPLLPVAPA